MIFSNGFMVIHMIGLGSLTGIKNNSRPHCVREILMLFFSKRENCGRKSVKTGRRFYPRPYFVTAAVDLSFNNWILISNRYRAKNFKQVPVSSHTTLFFPPIIATELSTGETAFEISADGTNSRIESHSACTTTDLRKLLS